MRQILAISTAIFRTLWRKKVPFYGVLFLSITLGALSYFSPEARVSLSGFVTHAKISIFLTVSLSLTFSFLTGITLISESFENWSVHLMKVRPISGLNYFLGYTLGLCVSVTVAFLLTLFVSFFTIFTNYRQLSKPVRSQVLDKYRYSEVAFLSRPLDFEALAELALKAEAESVSSEQIFLKSRKLKVARQELLVFEETKLFFDNVSPTSEIYFRFKLKIAGDVFGVKREFSQLKLTYALPHKKISTTTLLNFESSKPVKVRIPSTAISDQGSVQLSVVNNDEFGRSFYFSSGQEPRLTQNGSGLVLNVVKFILLSTLNILFFSSAGLLLGLMFSSAVSFFFSFAYFTIAIFANLGILPTKVSALIQFAFKSPFSLPFVSRLANGEFISSFWLLTYAFVLIVEFLIILLLAHLIYSRREVAAVMRSK